ncbi:hypothetical protein IWX50DRAFT_651226 [Phyllosticta citricarpa]
MFALRRSAAILSAPARSFSSSARAQKASMTLVGRVARDPELKTTSRGEEFITYSIACKDGTRVDSGVSFYNISKFSLSPALKDLMMDLTKGDSLANCGTKDLDPQPNMWLVTDRQRYRLRDS